MKNENDYNMLRGNKIHSWKQAGLVRNVLKNGNGIGNIRIPKGKSQNHVHDESYIWSLKMDSLLANAKDAESLSYVTREIESAIDNEKYNLPIADYQIKASKKADELNVDLGLL